MRKSLLIIIAAVLGVVGVFYFLSKKPPRSVQTERAPVEVEDESTDISCTGVPTSSQTEGPYYKTGSSERQNIAEGEEGDPLVVEGLVFNSDCEPIAGAWLDFWQAGADGNYDLAGFNLRGHQFTDDQGRYRLETVMPARYGGRTAHIHVKMRASEDSQVLTTQIYFPGESQNESDAIFNEALLVDLQKEDSTYRASYDFVLEEL